MDKVLEYSPVNEKLRRYVPDGSPAFNPQSASRVDNETVYFDSTRLNCYSYALNIPDHGWGKPGELKRKFGSSFKDQDMNPVRLDKLIQKDGLQRIGWHGCPRDNHVIAMFVTCKDDFHFAVRNKEGFWSHKSGRSIPHRITGSDSCDLQSDLDKLHSYETFAGFYMIPKSGILYYPRQAGQSEPLIEFY